MMNANNPEGNLQRNAANIFNEHQIQNKIQMKVRFSSWNLRFEENKSEPIVRANRIQLNFTFQIQISVFGKLIVIFC